MTPALDGVITIQDAAYMFDRHPDTIQYHIDRGNVAYRKIGSKRRGLWLLDFQSLVNLYGTPKNPPPSAQNQQFPY